MYKRTGKLLTRKYREYLLPTIMSAMSVLLASFIDGIIVGNLIGDKALSAVNLTSPLVLLFQAIFFLFGIGGSSAVLISKGKKEANKANLIYTLSIISVILVAVIIAVLGSLFINNITALLCQSGDKELFELVKEYASVSVLGSFLMTAVPFFVYFVRAQGKPKLSANILLIANVINLVMDLFYIGVLKMGVRGAALATLTGYFVGLIIEIVFMLGKSNTLKFVKIKLKDLKILGEICSCSIASTVNTLLLVVKSLFLNQIVLSVGGADGIAVYTVCNFSVTFISMFITGGSEAMVPIVSMLYGEKDFKGIDFVVKRAFSVVLSFCVITVAVLEIAPQLLLGMFQVSSASQLEIGIPAVRIFALSLIGMGICLVMMNYLQVTDEKSTALTISILRGFVLIIPSAYLFSSLYGITGIWCAFAVAEFLTVALAVLICLFIKIHSKGRLEGLLLHEAQNDTALLDVSLKSTTKDAVGISSRLIEFCENNNITQSRANLIGVAAEEAVENIMHSNEKEIETDVICHITDDRIILSLRDDGKPLDPTVFDKENQKRFTNTQLIISVADKVDYSNTLGLNNTVIYLDKSAIAK